MSRRKAAPTKVTSLRLPADLAAELSVVARADGLPVSEVVREAVGKHIATRRADEDFQARLREQMKKERELLERLAE
jgi:predicted DNA-binding protein